MKGTAREGNKYFVGLLDLSALIAALKRMLSTKTVHGFTSSFSGSAESEVVAELLS